MTISRPHRGGAPVGFVAELDSVEAGAVLYLRLWCEGPAALQQIRKDFTGSLGPEAGQEALQCFDQLCALCVRHGRRPLMRHEVTCRCLGADEACFANFIATAAEGDREDAILIATLLVRADMAMCLFALAVTFGLALKRISMRAQGPGPQVPYIRTVH